MADYYPVFKLSQVSSRLVCKFLQRKYGIKIRDTLEFWEFTPQDIRDYLLENYETSVPLGEIFKAARL